MCSTSRSPRPASSQSPASLIRGASSPSSDTSTKQDPFASAVTATSNSRSSKGPWRTTLVASSETTSTTSSRAGESAPCPQSTRCSRTRRRASPTDAGWRGSRKESRLDTFAPHSDHTLDTRRCDERARRVTPANIRPTSSRQLSHGVCHIQSSRHSRNTPVPSDRYCAPPTSSPLSTYSLRCHSGMIGTSWATTSWSSLKSAAARLRSS